MFRLLLIWTVIEIDIEQSSYLRTDFYLTIVLFIYNISFEQEWNSVLE